MLRATPALQKMASTRGGMRRILKRRLPVPKYIELATKAGSYKTPSTRPGYLGLHDVPPPRMNPSPRDREEREKMLRGIIDYPSEVRWRRRRRRRRESVALFSWAATAVFPGRATAVSCLRRRPRRFLGDCGSVRLWSFPRQRIFAATLLS